MHGAALVTIQSTSGDSHKMKTSITLLTLAALPLSILAADVTGTWKSEFDSQIGLQKYTYAFKQDGTNLTGKANSEVGDRKSETELKEGKVVGDAISFVEMLSLQDNEIRISYTGKLTTDGNEIKFTREVGEFAKEEIVAKREQPAPAAPSATIRIKAGQSTPFTDSSGNVWLPEQGFEGGATVEHDPATATPIAGTRDPGLFLSEHYSMDSFSCKLPNGKYVAKLYFAETYDGITGPGERVFSFSVQGHEFKNFDVWLKAGGPNRAYIETVPVEVTNGEFRIVFTSQVENPQINAIEIIPRSAGDTSAEAPSPAAALAAAPVAAAPVATAAVPAAPAAAATEPAAPAPPGATPVLQIDAGKVTGKVSPMLYGLMTEEINYSYEGGLYAELIRNRTFKANAQNPMFWSAVGEATMSIDTNQPLNSALNLSLKLDASKASKQSPVGVANGGYWGIPVRPNTKYRASFYARGENFSGPLNVSLESADGKTVFAAATVSKTGGEWNKYEVTLKTR